ncbi:MAG: indolepyruvate ferredoxin oxidoreductase family protein [Parvibaculaceae bacterium]
MPQARTSDVIHVSLDDKYDLAEGRIFLTGVQALVRLPLVQRRRDEEAGLNTAGYVTGYRGSPLATYDMQLLRGRKWLETANVRFQPGLNEDLALTSVWGSQQAEARGDGKHDGVFALWYGKGAGIDRSGDAFRHGNNAGSSRNGGVLILMGDDHRAESSSAVHASEFSMADFNVPVLNPADIQDILDFGLLGIAMSRFTGSWVSLKCNHDVVESGASILVDENRARPVLPTDFKLPPGGLNLRIPDTPLAQEARVIDWRLPAIKAFCRANGIDRTVFKPKGARLGIVTTGKAYLEVLQALEDLRIDTADAEHWGIALYKVGMPWPLEPEGVKAFCEGLDTILCVEEKRGLIEPQVKDILFAERNVRSVIGKHDEAGRTLFPATGTLSSNRIGIEIGRRLLEAREDAALRSRWEELEAREAPRDAAILPFARKPYFCSGCPHNRSTVVPEGSRGGAGTGCNYMVMWMDRRSDGYTQMGADGTNWIGEAPFSKRDHMFQNMGDGTYNHSGLLAIRACIAAGVNITFKILYNDAVAMTGGQVHDGPLSVAGIARQVLAEGVQQVVVVADDPARNAGIPNVTLRHRDEIDAVQRELREVPGVTVLIYDQMCATEKRRRRKRGLLDDPQKRAFINHQVCEGCGDCGVKSNCVSILPKETDFGRKRMIDQHSCNKDYSCLDGFCPSFVTVEGGRLRRPEVVKAAPADPLPEPSVPALDHPYGIVIAGVGGAGIVTTSSILGMAAHLDGKGCTTLDMMGLAQKGGAVTSHIRIARDPSASRAARIPEGSADLVLGCDIMSVAGVEPLSTIARDRCEVIVNTNEIIPGEFTRTPDLEFPSQSLRHQIEATAGRKAVRYLDATAMAKEVTGDPITTNMLLVGFAFQQGLVPLSREAIHRAVEINGASVEANLAAFEAGRRLFADLQRKPVTSNRQAEPKPDLATGLDGLIDARAAFLTDYQDEAYAERYRRFVGKVREVEAARVPPSAALTAAVARNLAKLMAYKDEYEVGRLHASDAFRQDLERQFEGSYRLRFHLAPPLLARRDPVTGEPRKMAFGPWMLGVLRLLSRLKGLRGTTFDIFGYTAERSLERQLIREYETTIEGLLPELGSHNHATAVSIASLPETIRGFGHVKLASIAKAKDRECELLETYSRPQVLAAAE